MAKKRTLLTTLKLLVQVALADERLEQQEMDLLTSFCAKHGLKDNELQRILADPSTVRERDLPRSMEKRRELLNDMIDIAAADGELAGPELQLCSMFGNVLNLSGSDIDARLLEGVRSAAEARGTHDTH